MLINNQKSTILITGGLGYIGAHVAALFIKKNISVVILDNVWHGNPNDVPEATIIYGDVGDKLLLEQLFSQYQFSAVIHMAAFIQVGESVKFPEKYFQNNVVKTITLLDTMLKHQCRYLVFSSSAAIFGEPQYTPIDEQHPKNPTNPYGAYKLQVEKLLENSYAKQGLRFVALRYFNAAGCSANGSLGELHEPETHLIPLILHVANGKREFIPIYGNDYATPDGTCIRDYIHVEDLSQAHLLALNYLWQDGNENFFNLGTNTGYSVLEIIAAVEKITEKKIPRKILPRRTGDSAILIADGCKAQKLLDWHPQLSNLETILAHAWQWEQSLCLTSLS